MKTVTIKQEQATQIARLLRSFQAELPLIQDALPPTEQFENLVIQDTEYARALNELVNEFEDSLRESGVSESEIAGDIHDDLYPGGVIF